MNRHQWPFWTAWGLALGLLIVISCVDKARRTFPLNMILLAAFTIVEAFLVGMISARYSIEAVMLAFLVTGAAVVALSLFAVNTKIDATRWGNMLWIALIIVLVLMLVGFFWISKWLYLVIAGVAALIFSAYLIYDIQLIMGGRKYQISPDEYVFAALNVYLVSDGGGPHVLSGGGAW
jgi:FtsH-binding integral membrane protein